MRGKWKKTKSERWAGIKSRCSVNEMLLLLLLLVMTIMMPLVRMIVMPLVRMIVMPLVRMIVMPMVRMVMMPMVRMLMLMLRTIMGKPFEHFKRRSEMMWLKFRKTSYSVESKLPRQRGMAGRERGKPSKMLLFKCRIERKG